MTFTHLHVRSGYSFMESTITIDQLVNRAKELKFTHLALTDHNVLYGAVEFYQACLKHHIKPIIGMTVSIAHETELIDHCILLAKNNRGYQDLMKLSTNIQENNEKELTLHELERFTDNIICILQFKNSSLAFLAEKEQNDLIDSELNKWQQSTSDFYLGIESDHLTNNQQLQSIIQTLID